MMWGCIWVSVMCLCNPDVSDLPGIGATDGGEPPDTGARGTGFQPSVKAVLTLSD